MGKKNCEAIVVSPYWPTNTFGGNIACRASLLVYLQVFSKVHFVWVADEEWGAGKAFSRSRTERVNEWNAHNIDFHHVPMLSQAKWWRFIRSIFSKLPAITMQYTGISKNLALTIDEIVRSDQGKRTERVLFFEEVLPACCIGEIRRVVPDMPLAIRSLNVVSEVFEGLAQMGKWPTNLLWKYEIRKIRRFEKNVCQLADKVWAISDQDASEYSNRLSLTVDGVFGVCLDTARYASVEAGDPHTVVSVGGIDLRKGQGWDAFIHRVWPRVLENVPNATLLIAGSGSERFRDVQRGIQGLGFVDDERDVLARGRIFLNSQYSGSGIKLKSIVAMLSGKVLISTRTGLQGVASEHGEHFLMADTENELISHLVSLMEDDEKAARISLNARLLSQEVYDLDRLISTATPLVKALADRRRRNRGR